jgi:hypothetical protein
MLTQRQIIVGIRERHKLDETDDVQVADLCAKSIKQTDEDTHTLTATISTEMMDRDHEVVIAGGMKATNFLKTGAVFWNHNYNLPVAKAIKLRPSKSHIESTAKFAKRPSGFGGDFFPDFARAMVQQGVVKGVSIGFIPKEMRNPTDKDKENFGDDLINVISKWELLEWSLAPVQSNPDALVSAVGKAVSSGVVPRGTAELAFDLKLPDRLPCPDKQVKRQVLLVLDKPQRNAGDDLVKSIGDMVHRELGRAMGKMYV